MQYLFGRKIIYLTVMLMCSFLANAQMRYLNLEEHDDKRVHFGISVGANRSYYNFLNPTWPSSSIIGHINRVVHAIGKQIVFKEMIIPAIEDFSIIRINEPPDLRIAFTSLRKASIDECLTFFLRLLRLHHSAWTLLNQSAQLKFNIVSENGPIEGDIQIPNHCIFRYCNYNKHFYRCSINFKVLILNFF